MEEATLVAGSGSAVGRAVARRQVAEGQVVVTLDRVPPVGDPCGIGFTADLDDPADTARVLAEIAGRWRVTRLVNNVEHAEPSTLAGFDVEAFDRAVSANLRCPLQCVQAVLPGMKAGGFGRIVNISSRDALGHERLGVYAAAKGAINTITRTWALEVATHGITVNAVAPGIIDDTGAAGPEKGDATSERLWNSIAMGRPGRSEDVADAVAFLLGQRAGYVTGQLLYVCGGLSIGGLVAP